MINTHEKFGNDNISVEVNWDKSVMPCKKVRFTIGKESAVMDKGDLFALLTIIADNEEQEKLMIVKNEEVIGVRKMLKVKTHKTVEAGEHINFPMTQYVTRRVFEKMLEVKAIRPEDVISTEEAEKRMTTSEEVT